MHTTLSNRVVTTIAAAAVALGALGAAALLPGRPVAAAGTSAVTAGTAAAVAQEAPGAGAQAAAARYWTPARMSAVLQAADPAAAARDLVEARYLVKRARVVAPREPALAGGTGGKGLRWTRGGAVAAAVGKVFFTLGDADYVCSGTLVGRGQAEVVLTAAHCVSSGPARGAAQWATNWVFVPGYRNGQLPYGEYTASRFVTEPGWSGPQGGTEQYDVAFVRVTAATLNGWSGAAAVPPPGLPVQFRAGQDGPEAGRGYVFGYPAEPPYTGLYPSYCAGPVAAADGSARTACAMTAGDSGGPWLAGFSPRSGAGRVFAVSTYKLSGDLRVLYGAVLGPQARAAYLRAVRPPGWSQQHSGLVRAAG